MAMVLNRISQGRGWRWMQICNWNLGIFWGLLFEPESHISSVESKEAREVKRKKKKIWNNVAHRVSLGSRSPIENSMVL